MDEKPLEMSAYAADLSSRVTKGHNDIRLYTERTWLTIDIRLQDLVCSNIQRHNRRGVVIWRAHLSYIACRSSEEP